MSLIAVLGLVLAAPAAPLIPRAVLFKPADRFLTQVAPDGKSLGFIAPGEGGVFNVWVSGLDGSNAQAVTRETKRPVTVYRFSADSSQILYLQDSDGDENYHLYGVELQNPAHVRDLTPFRGVKAQNVMTSGARPKEVLVGLNKRDPRVFDVYRIDLGTGAVVLDTENPGDVLSFTTDAAFAVRGATVFDPKTLETIVRVRDGASGPFRDLLRWPFEESPMFGQINGGTVLAGFAPDGQSLYVVSSTGSPTARLVRVSASSGKVLEVLAEHPRADVDADFGLDFLPRVLVSPTDGRPQAVAFDPLEPVWVFLDPAVRADVARIQKDHPGQIVIQSRDDRDSVWVVSQVPKDAPAREFLYERGSQTLRPVFPGGLALDSYVLGTTRATMIPSRDGLSLPAYLTLPPGSDGKNLPMILLPHGGPWYRDTLGFDPLVQLLANRGYAVLRVNFRGSIGFGMSYLNAGNHQFGLAMEDDLMDGVAWAIKEGIADPKRVAIMGGSAGGYATLRGITEHPETFACAIDLVGPSDLKLLMSTIPPYWGPVRARWIRRLGDVSADDALNRKLSPLYHAEAIRVPLLVGQGQNDPRVSIQNSDLIVKAARGNGVKVTYIVYPDEGHGFARPENNMDFFGHAEAFLKECLGGRAEPYEKPAGSTGELR
jgi:dipeptidyl aminopeptidase/acylaminoacyl peptidase